MFQYLATWYVLRATCKTFYMYLVHVPWYWSPALTTTATIISSSTDAQMHVT